MKIEVREEWKGDSISKPDKIAEIVRKLISEMEELDRDKEHIWVFNLNGHNEIISIEHVGVGVLHACVTHPREVFRRAIMDSAFVIMIAHNHPSGTTEASIHDNNLTETIARAGAVVGIPLLDHVIVANDDFYSYKQDNKL